MSPRRRHRLQDTVYWPLCASLAALRPPQRPACWRRTWQDSLAETIFLAKGYMHTTLIQGIEGYEGLLNAFVLAYRVTCNSS